MKATNRLLALSSVTLSVALILGVFMVAILAQGRPTASAAQEVTAEAKPVEITVRGTGKISARPDAMILNVGVQAQEGTVAEAQTKVTAAANAMTAKLKALGIAEKDFRTSSYNVEPIMDYAGGEKAAPQMPQLTGFRVFHMYEITLRDPSRAAELIDALVSAGANTVYGTMYTFSDPEGLSRQAFDGAVKDAAEKAEKLAGLQGLKLGKVLTISEASVGGPAYGEKGMAGGGAGFVPGQQTLQVDVVVTYEAAK